MTPEERLALALAEIQREIVALDLRLEQLARDVQAIKDIFRGCACFGVTT